MKSFNIPAVEEVAVESVSGWVTISEDEWLLGSVPPVEPSSGVDNLIEEGNHVNRVRSRAGTVVVGVLGRVSHMRLVVGRVEVYTIPAGREEDLGTKAIRAGRVWETAGVAGDSVVVEANEADGLARKVIRVCALEWIACKHAETFGESSKVVVVGSTSLTVIRISTRVRPPIIEIAAYR